MAAREWTDLAWHSDEHCHRASTGGKLGMDVPVVALPTIDELQRFVRQTLCEHDRLDPDQTPMFEAPLLRRGEVCGTIFHIEGPRLLRTSALWPEEEHRILFYDSIGLRFHEVRLSEAPELMAK